MNKLLSLYGLKWNPFSPDVPVEALFRSQDLEHFCWRMEAQAREGGFALITGEPGTGKSVTLRLLAHHLSALPDLQIGVLSRPQSSIADFYRELGLLFGVVLAPHNRWAGFKALRQKWLAHVDSTRFRPVLLVDEAQEMPPSVLAELRILSSSDFDSKAILTVVLSGDSRLAQQFRSEELLPLASRIRVRIKLDFLSPKELAEFLTHALNQAGNPNIMTKGLVTTLAEHAAGNPRVLSIMANELLATASHRQLSLLDEKLYLEVFPPPARSKSRNNHDGLRP